MTNWTKEELLAYILIYCGDADFATSDEENEYLKSRFESSIYEKMLSEYEKDSPEDKVAKIKDSYNNLGHTKEEGMLVYEEIHNLFTSDADYDELEKKVLKELEKIIL